MSRYYSQQQQYSQVDDPADITSSTINMEQYTGYEPNRGQGQYTGYEPNRVHDQYTEYAPNRNPAQQRTAATYEDMNLPPRTKRSWWSGWSTRRKLFVFGGIVAFIVILAIIIGVAVALSRSSFHYVGSTVQVTNETSFATGGATTANPQDSLNDGIGRGQDVYKYYSGDASAFPPSTAWVSFEDMWNANKPTIEGACSTLGEGPDNTPEMIDDIYYAIQNRSAVSLVDHRYILAIILQESNGCPRVDHTVSSGGVRNPGLMQSHNGHAFDSSDPKMSILQMVTDGTQGTAATKGDAGGWGLVQNLDTYGDPYSAARGYNSGYIPESGNLSEAAGATACYVSDVANRLTGWVRAPHGCKD